MAWELFHNPPTSLSLLRVRTDKTHCEHNESGYPSIADMRADIDWRRLVPQGEVAATSTDTRIVVSR